MPALRIQLIIHFAPGCLWLTARHRKRAPATGNCLPMHGINIADRCATFFHCILSSFLSILY